MKLKKIGLILAALCVGASMTACSMMNGATSTPAPTMSMPAATMGATPTATGAMNGDNAAMTAAMTATESAALSQKANAAAAQVSEIDGCVTAIMGNTCLAGVTFDKQYQGEMTDRIRDMVSARIQSVAPSVERVAVTHDPEIVAQIQSVADQIAGAKNLSDVAQGFDSVLDKME